MKIYSGHFLRALALFCFGTTPLFGADVEVINAGIGGNSSADLLSRVERDVIAKSPDTVVLMVGTNDRLNSRKLMPAKEYEANVVKLVQKIKAGSAKVVLVTPPPCVEALLFKRHDPAKFADQSPTERMAEVREIIVKIAREHEATLVDLHLYLVEKNLADDNKMSVLRVPSNGGGNDGVHLNAEGYKLMGEMIAKAIVAEKLDTAKVICFGDSITYGAGMKGAGTSEGETYPAFLKKALASK